MIGIVEDIDDTAMDIPEVEGELTKKVTRITIRNIIKSVKVSFWGEQALALAE